MNIVNEVTLETEMTANDLEAPATTVQEIEETHTIEQTINTETQKDKIVRTAATIGKAAAQTMKRITEKDPLTGIPLDTGVQRQTWSSTDAEVNPTNE